MILRSRGTKYIALNLLLMAVLSIGGCSYSGKSEKTTENGSVTAISETAPEAHTEEAGKATTSEFSEETGNVTTAAPSEESEGNLLNDTPGSSDKLSQEELPKGFADALSERELLIDYIIEGSTIFALVNSKGSSEEFGDYFVIFIKDREGLWTRTYENDFVELKPWKIETADIDGDSAREILIAVVKSTTYDPVEKNRMFIFNMTDGVLVKKWTGSQIAGTWRNFCSGNLIEEIPGDELIFIERLANGRERISVYSWFDFGFFLLADSDELPTVMELTVSGDNSMQITLGDGRTRNMVLKDGKLVAIEE